MKTLKDTLKFIEIKHSKKGDLFVDKENENNYTTKSTFWSLWQGQVSAFIISRHI